MSEEHKMHERMCSTRFISYKLEGRRHSILEMKDPSTDKISEFVPDVQVYYGNNLIRKFQNDQHESVIVKSPVQSIKADYLTPDEFKQVCKFKLSFVLKEFNFL